MTRIALVIGGTRGTKNADGSFTPDSTDPPPVTPGEYLQPPFDYCSVGDWDILDRRGTVHPDGSETGDGLIHTSYGRDLTLGWDESLRGLNNSGGVSLAEDELIFSYTRIPGVNWNAVNPRGGAIAVDAHGDVWTGGYYNGWHQKLSGATTAPGTAAFIGYALRFYVDSPYVCLGGYGALVDFDGVLWSARWGSSGSGEGLWYDPLVGIAMLTQQLYGLGLDPIMGNVWASQGDNPAVYEYDRNTGRPVMMHDSQTGQDVPHVHSYYAKGLVVRPQVVTDPQTQEQRCESHVWIAGNTDGSGGSSTFWTKIIHLAPYPDTTKRDPGAISLHHRIAQRSSERDSPHLRIPAAAGIP